MVFLGLICRTIPSLGKYGKHLSQSLPFHYHWPLPMSLELHAFTIIFALFLFKSVFIIFNLVLRKPEYANVILDFFFHSNYIPISTLGHSISTHFNRIRFTRHFIAQCNDRNRIWANKFKQCSFKLVWSDSMGPSLLDCGFRRASINIRQFFTGSKCTLIIFLSFFLSFFLEIHLSFFVISFFVMVYVSWIGKQINGKIELKIK